MVVVCNRNSPIFGSKKVASTSSELRPLEICLCVRVCWMRFRPLFGAVWLCAIPPFFRNGIYRFVEPPPRSHHHQHHHHRRDCRRRRMPHFTLRKHAEARVRSFTLRTKRTRAKCVFGSLKSKRPTTENINKAAKDIRCCFGKCGNAKIPFSIMCMHLSINFGVVQDPLSVLHDNAQMRPFFPHYIHTARWKKGGG